MARESNRSDTVDRRRIPMCLTCGCGQPHETHGNPDNITYEDLEKAAKAGEVSVADAAKNIQDGLANA
jgi:hypothetical protein